MHSPWNVLIPCITPFLQLVPFITSVLQSLVLRSWISICESWYRGSEVSYFGSDIDDAVSPQLLLSRLGFSTEIHINTPVIRFPRHLPIKVQAAKQLHANIEPEARCSDSNGPCTPATLFDQRTGSSNVVHPLQSFNGHDFVHVEDDSCSCADYRVPVRIL